ncbi:DUF6095 family protein [Lacinutrix iliipiscaria]|uniref:DUF6095 family protein n=1 Tax=Lacinutrix iliipiscaria TaxID=1230532 RepID=A0ABW5WRI8_9FLAO
METNRTDKELLVKGIKTMGITLAGMFLGPTLLYIGFSNEDKPLYIPLIISGIIICALAIYFAFKGLNIIMNSMFKKK